MVRLVVVHENLFYQVQVFFEYIIYFNSPQRFVSESLPFRSSSVIRLNLLVEQITECFRKIFELLVLKILLVTDPQEELKELASD
jgi:hypothetical protein